MIVGVPRETKAGERRVALLPDAARSLVAAGHEVRVAEGAGAGVGASDADYGNAGARVTSPAQAWDADLVVKVKEMQPADFEAAPPARAIFSFHHLPGEPHRTRELARRGDTALAFEMLRDETGEFPMLAPMSVIAGRLAVEQALQAGIGVARVLVLGAGHAGLAAARAAMAHGASVVVLTRSETSRDAARAQGFEADLATPACIEREALEADLLVGAVFVPATPTPKLVPRALVRRMKRGAMIVDVSIDAGGVAETSRATKLADPTYVEEGVVHACVPNLPASVPAEAAAAISAAALPWVRRMADAGVAQALRASPELRGCALLWKGAVLHPGIAAEAGIAYTPTHPDLAP